MVRESNKDGCIVMKPYKKQVHLLLGFFTEVFVTALFVLFFTFWGRNVAKKPNLDPGLFWENCVYLLLHTHFHLVHVVPLYAVKVPCSF